MKSIRRAYLEKKNQKSYENIFIKENNSFLDEKKIANNNKNNNIIRTTYSPVNENKKIKIHEDNLSKLEKLQKELDNLEKENELISKEINSSKKEEKIQLQNYNKIIKDINKENIECNKIKEINNKKNREYSQLKEQHRQLMIDFLRNIHQNVINELNRNSLHRFFDRLVFLSRMRTQNNNLPPMSEQQLQALPISNYRNRNNTTEKCIICGFPFCYNDTIIRLRRCNHLFHKACLINTLTISRTSICPTCRVPIV